MLAVAVLDFDRVGQLVVPKASGKRGIGSGYLLADRLVLTAAHVVGDAAPGAAIEVAFPAAEASATGAVVWSGSADGLDGALVELAAGPQGPVGVRAREVRWGRLTGQRPGVPAAAVGFPRALKDVDGERVADQPSGTINPGAAFGGRYDLNLTGAHPLSSAGDPSPWAGLSGAALFSDELLIGVVVIDTPNFQSGRLTAVPAWRLLAHQGFVDELTRHGCARQWESVELAPLFERGRGRLDSPASLLRADTAVVRFRGRDDVLATLQEWAEAPGELAVRLLVGPGGQGKTRLARQLCERLRASGWVSGFVGAHADRAAASRLADSRLPVLVIVDHAETRAEQVRELIDAATDPAKPMRVLLLARSAGEWWQQLRPKLRYQVHLDAPATLPALEDTPAGRRDAYQDAAADFAGGLARLPSHADTDWLAVAAQLAAPDLSAAAYASILTIHLQALTDLLGEDAAKRQGGRVDPDELDDVLLDHEQSYWEETAARRGLVEPGFQHATRKRAVATATVCGAADEDEAIATVTRVPGLIGKDPEERLGVARWLADLYPPAQGRYWGSLQPDRVGEHLIGQVTRDKPGVIATVLVGASDDQRTRALTVLARAVAHQPHLADFLRELIANDPASLGPPAIAVAFTAADPQPVLDALHAAVRATTEPRQLFPVANALPPQSLMLGPFKVELTSRLVVLLRPLAERDPDAFLPILATALNNQSNGLAALGRREQALEAIEEAVGVYRELAQGRPDAFLRELAGALNNQSNGLAALGRREQALAAIKEALSIRRQLAQERPDAFLPDLAEALNNQSLRLAEVGRRKKALAANQEALSIHRQLAQTRPNAFLPELAGTLNNQSLRLAEVGRRKKALAAIEEALSIHRQLAQARPDAFLPDLGRSLRNQSDRLAEVGRREEALAAIEEAVSIHGQLAQARPDAFLPDLARSLHNQSTRLAEVGRPEEALAAMEQAASIRRQLPQARRPDAFPPDLARSSNDQRVRPATLRGGTQP